MFIKFTACPLWVICATVMEHVLHPSVTPLLIQPFIVTDFHKRAFWFSAPSVWYLAINQHWSNLLPIPLKLWPHGTIQFLWPTCEKSRKREICMAKACYSVIMVWWNETTKRDVERRTLSLVTILMCLPISWVSLIVTLCYVSSLQIVARCVWSKLWHTCLRSKLMHAVLQNCNLSNHTVSNELEWCRKDISASASFFDGQCLKNNAHNYGIDNCIRATRRYVCFNTPQTVLLRSKHCSRSFHIR